MKALARKFSRYATVSAISTSVTLTVLGALVYSRSLSAGWANVLATAAGTVPSFELNRRWVWAKTGRRSLRREVLPFCALSASGLVISTLVVSVAARLAAEAGLGHGVVTLMAQAANVSTFGALWVLQYVLLDRVLFGPGRRGRAGRALPAATPLGGDTPDGGGPATALRPATPLQKAA
jgi:putative flippase GtrA